VIASASQTHSPVAARPDRVRPRRSSRLRWPGWVFVVTSLFLAIGAFNGQNNLLFFAFGLSVSAILLSGLVSGSAMLGLSVRRLPPRPVSVGGNGVIRYEITNRNRLLPVFGVLIQEILERDASPEAGEARLTPALVASARAGETVRVSGRVGGSHTGVVRLRGLRIRSSLPFGLIEKRIDVDRHGELEIHPPVLPVRRARARALGHLRTPVAVPSRQAGGDEEFLGVREFVQGDSARKVAWARSAAHDSLVVRTNARPRPETYWITVDPDAGSARDLQLVQSAAASLAADRIQQGVSVGLDIPEWGVRLKPRGGREQLHRILTALCRRRGTGLTESGGPVGERVVVSAGGRREAGSGLGSSVNATETATWLAARARLPADMLDEIGHGSRSPSLRLRLREPAAGVAGAGESNGVTSSRAGRGIGS
jgi:uncharacterized protein (DUF58 family)